MATVNYRNRLPRPERRKPLVPIDFTRDYVLSLVQGWKQKAIGSSQIHMGRTLVIKISRLQALVVRSANPFSVGPTVEEVVNSDFRFVAKATIKWPEGSDEPLCTIKAFGEL